LFATFKQPTGESVADGPGVINPSVKIEYATPTGDVVEILPPSDMIQISAERFFYNWVIPDTAPLTTYSIMYSGIIDDILVSRTEDLIIGNPNVTTTRNFLRYGPYSFVSRPRTTTPRQHPQLPKGEF
jgi:hypothetical protein